MSTMCKPNTYTLFLALVTLSCLPTAAADQGNNQNNGQNNTQNNDQKNNTQSNNDKKDAQDDNTQNNDANNNDQQDAPNDNTQNDGQDNDQDDNTQDDNDTNDNDQDNDPTDTQDDHIEEDTFPSITFAIHIPQTDQEIKALASHINNKNEYITFNPRAKTIKIREKFLLFHKNHLGIQDTPIPTASKAKAILTQTFWNAGTRVSILGIYRGSVNADTKPLNDTAPLPYNEWTDGTTTIDLIPYQLSYKEWIGGAFCLVLIIATLYGYYSGKQPHTEDTPTKQDKDDDA